MDLLHGITPEPMSFESLMQLIDFLSYDEKTNPESKNFSKFESQIWSNCFAVLSSQKSIAPENLPKIGLILASLNTKGSRFCFRARAARTISPHSNNVKDFFRNDTISCQYDPLSWC